MDFQANWVYFDGFPCQNFLKRNPSSRHAYRGLIRNTRGLIRNTRGLIRNTRGLIRQQKLCRSIVCCANLHTSGILEPSKSQNWSVMAIRVRIWQLVLASDMSISLEQQKMCVDPGRVRNWAPVVWYLADSHSTATLIILCENPHKKMPTKADFIVFVLCREKTLS